MIGDSQQDTFTNQNDGSRRYQSPDMSSARVKESRGGIKSQNMARCVKIPNKKNIIHVSDQDNNSSAMLAKTQYQGFKPVMNQ